LLLLLEYGIVVSENGQAPGGSLHSQLDKRLEEGGDTEMKLEKLFDIHILTGVVLGGIIGLYFPLDAYKGLLVIAGVVMGLKVVATK